jgi:hypothetical protein
MTRDLRIALSKPFRQTVLWAVEYGVAVGIALLCSYWILEGRW